MAKNVYIGIPAAQGSKARLITNGLIGVNGDARRIIRGYIGDEQQKARKFYNAWVTESPLPFDFFQGAAVVVGDIANARLHIMGGSLNPRAHYSWDGTRWQSESTLPYDFVLGSAIVYGGRIHIFGSNNNSNLYSHYSFSGGEWRQEIGNPVYFFGFENAVIFNGKLCLVSSYWGSYSQFRYICEYDDENDAWITHFNNKSANAYASGVSDGSVIYMLGGTGNGGACYQTWDGQEFSDVKLLPYSFTGSYVIVYKGDMHVLGTASGNGKMHCIFDKNDSCTRIASLPKRKYYCPAVVFNGKIHLLGGIDDDSYRDHYSWEDE